MKTSNELYDRYGELIRDAKESIRDILSKQPEERVKMDDWVATDFNVGYELVRVMGIQLKDNMIELILFGGDIMRSEDVLSSEWLYILECVEYELEEKEGRV